MKTLYKLNKILRVYYNSNGYIDYRGEKVGESIVHETDKNIDHHGGQDIVINGVKYEIESVLEDIGQNVRLVSLRKDEIEHDTKSLKAAYDEKVIGLDKAIRDLKEEIKAMNAEVKKNYRKKWFR